MNYAGELKIRTEAFFWKILEEILSDNLKEWHLLSVDMVLKKMMTKSKGHLNPSTARQKLEELNRLNI